MAVGRMHVQNGRFRSGVEGVDVIIPHQRLRAVVQRYSCPEGHVLRRHLEEPHQRRRFEIVVADDFTAHWIGTVRDLVWETGSFLMIPN